MLFNNPVYVNLIQKIQIGDSKAYKRVTLRTIRVASKRCLSNDWMNNIEPQADTYEIAA